MNPSDMNPSPDFDRRLTAWLDDQAPMREPDGLTYAVLARTRRTRRMPRWANPERWLSMAVITRPALAPPLRFAWLLLIVLLALALAAGGAIVGAGLIARLVLPTASARHIRSQSAGPQSSHSTESKVTEWSDPAATSTRSARTARTCAS